MLPTEISYLAQERCKELRGEVREPTIEFVNVNPRQLLARLFHNFGNTLQAKPKPKVTANQKGYGG